MQTETFATGSLSKALLRFAGPYLLGVMLQNLYGAVDLIVVGQFASTADVSAVTIGSQLMNMVTQLVIGFATGVTVLVGRGFGAGDQRSLSKTLGAAIALFGVMALCLTGFYFAGANLMVAAMQTPAQALSQTKEYLLVCAAGIPFIVAYNVISSVLMGMGNTKTPFLFVAVACGVNIAMDVALVWGVGLGALGAAIATTLAQLVSVAFALLYLRKRGLGFPLSRQHIGLHRRTILRIGQIGAPVAVQNLLVGASFLFITAIINQMGVIASAAVGVVEKVIGFLMIPPAAFGAAVSTVAAQNIGAGRPDRARRSLWVGIGLALIPSVLVVLVSEFFGMNLASLFSKDTQVIHMAYAYLQSYVLDCLLVSFVFPANGYFNSSGYSWFTLVHSLLTTLLCRVPLSFLFSRMGGATLFTVGWAAPLSTLASILLCVGFLKWMDYAKRKKDKAAPESC